MNVSSLTTAFINERKSPEDIFQVDARDEPDIEEKGFGLKESRNSQTGSLTRWLADRPSAGRLRLGSSNAFGMCRVEIGKRAVHSPMIFICLVKTVNAVGVARHGERDGQMRPL